MGRGNVDDAAHSLLDHVRQHGLAAIPGTVKINGETAPPIRFGHLQRVAEHIDPGAIDQHIDATEARDGQFDQRLPLLV